MIEALCQFLEMSKDGNLDSTPWAAPGDAFLALDRNGDGVINDLSEISFVYDLRGAQTDMEGLRAYDSNADGLINPSDERFADFIVWNDQNSDGISQESEMQSLAEAAISSINLELQPSENEVAAPDVLLYNTATFTREDGSRGEVADVGFIFHELDSEYDLVPTSVSPEDQAIASLIQTMNSFGSEPSESMSLSSIDLVSTHSPDALPISAEMSTNTIFL